jgi:hypothetical protein
MLSHRRLSSSDVAATTPKQGVFAGTASENMKSPRIG